MGFGLGMFGLGEVESVANDAQIGADANENVPKAVQVGKGRDILAEIAVDQPRAKAENEPHDGDDGQL